MGVGVRVLGSLMVVRRRRLAVVRRRRRRWIVRARWKRRHDSQEGEEERGEVLNKKVRGEICLI